MGCSGILFVPVSEAFMWVNLWDFEKKQGNGWKATVRKACGHWA